MIDGRRSTSLLEAWLHKRAFCGMSSFFSEIEEAEETLSSLEPGRKRGDATRTSMPIPTPMPAEGNASALPMSCVLSNCPSCQQPYKWLRLRSRVYMSRIFDTHISSSRCLSVSERICLAMALGSGFLVCMQFDSVPFEANSIAATATGFVRDNDSSHRGCGQTLPLGMKNDQVARRVAASVLGP